MPSLHWTWQRFEALDVDALYDLLQLRAKVFILEQGPYLDLDGADRQSWHLMGRDAQGHMQAYLRVVDPGVKFVEPSIGRVVTSLDVRGQGAGRALMQEGIKRCQSAWPGQGIRISAQARLTRFYQSLGFVTHLEPYQEDGIAHQNMVLTGAEA